MSIDDRMIKIEGFNKEESPQENIGNVLKTNPYGRKEISGYQERQEILESIPSTFIDSFKKRGYLEEGKVSINSGIDPTVFFIGAPISVLKPYIVSRTIPSPGICISQPSFRSRNAKKLVDPNSDIKRGSLFTGFSALCNYDEGEKMLSHGLSFLVDDLNIPEENILIKINSKDVDLYNMLSESGYGDLKKSIDSKEPGYYRHKYGLGDIKGRNFNIALKSKSGYNDVGNFIIIEDGFDKYGIELALGDSTIMKELYGLNHVLDTSVVGDLVPGNTKEHRKFQDSIIVTSLLYGLGIKVGSSNTKGRIFKSYLNGLLYNGKLLGYDIDEICWYVLKYNEMNGNNQEGLAEFIKSYYEKNVI